MLVDAQLTKTNAEKVLQEIKATKKPPSIIYLTHEHADHFLGLEVFKEAYPTARILANSNVVDRINKVYQEKPGRGHAGGRGQFDELHRCTQSLRSSRALRVAHLGVGGQPAGKLRRLEHARHLRQAARELSSRKALPDNTRRCVGGGCCHRFALTALS
jgi:metal-dependent hydrolase (beta-lactamase superfamily II)